MEDATVEKNTVDDLIQKLTELSQNGYGQKPVYLEGCDCEGEWDGGELGDMRWDGFPNHVMIYRA